MTNIQDLLEQATLLVKSESGDGDEKELLVQISNSNNKDVLCESIENGIPALAQNGNSREIGISVRALEKSGASPNIRKILHYFAQSEAVRGKNLMQKDSTETLGEVLNNISDAFLLANALDSAAHT